MLNGYTYKLQITKLSLVRTAVVIMLLLVSRMNAQKQIEATPREDLSFSSNKRILYTTINSLDVFETKHPKWSHPLKEILSEYLHTSIVIDQKENLLVSFDGSRFPLKSNASALDLTNEVIDKIGAMYFGKREVDKLKKNNAY